MLHISLEVTHLVSSRPTGIARYARELIGALADVAETEELKLTLLYRTSRWRHRATLPKLPGAKLQAWRNSSWPLRRPYDLVHATFDRLPDWPNIIKVATVHDLYAARGFNFDAEADRRRMMDFYKNLAQRADFLCFVSEHTRQDFLELVGFDAARTAVTPLGVGAQFRPVPTSAREKILTAYGLTEPYILFIGLTNPNKNLPRLLQAYAQCASRRTHRLAIVGHVPDDQVQSLSTQVDQLGIRNRVLLSGYVQDEHLPALYSGASAFAFPSLYEGFGLPILEAMACGAPVLTSTASACPEVAGGHGFLANPTSVDDIACELDQCVAAEQEHLVKAMAYAVQRSWDRTAQLTISAYRTASRLERR